MYNSIRKPKNNENQQNTLSSKEIQKLKTLDPSPRTMTLASQMILHHKFMQFSKLTN